MSEDLAKQLASYKAQLQQVEAALSGNGENEDLLKLKKALKEVIELTKDLLSTQPSETLASSDSFASTQPTHSWKVGDKCMAMWNEDGQCYEVEIEEIDEENGTPAITFAVYSNAEVTPLLNLKPIEEGRKAKEDSGNKPMSKKEMIAQQSEYRKKKSFEKSTENKRAGAGARGPEGEMAAVQQQAVLEEQERPGKEEYFCFSGKCNGQSWSRNLWNC
jgi:survival-of-motor-neuron-related-splicing factor 30